MNCAKKVLITAILLVISMSLAYGGANNNTPSDTFQSYQIALRDGNINLLRQVYYFADSSRMTSSRFNQELKSLKQYDGYKNYTISQVIDEGDSAKLKVKGTIHGRENVRRTFQLKRFHTGWMIVKVWNT